MRQVLMSTGGVTLDQVNRYANPFTRSVVGIYLQECERNV